MRTKYRNRIISLERGGGKSQKKEGTLNKGEKRIMFINHMGKEVYFMGEKS